MQETQEVWVRFQGLEDSPGEGNSDLPQYSCLENPMDLVDYSLGDAKSQDTTE